MIVQISVEKIIFLVLYADWSVFVVYVRTCMSYILYTCMSYIYTCMSYVYIHVACV